MTSLGKGLRLLHKSNPRIEVAQSQEVQPYQIHPLPSVYLHSDFACQKVLHQGFL